MSEIEIFTGGWCQTNAMFVPVPGTGNEVIVFDAPEGVNEYLAANQLKAAALVLTHAHFDHMWAVAETVATQQCPVYLHPVEADLLENPNKYDIFGLGYDIAGFADWMPIQVPDRGEATFEVAGIEYSARHAPGHSPGSVGFYSRADGYIIGGDVLMARSVGRTDLPGGDGRVLAESIHNHFYTLPDDTTVYPGHGPITTIAEEKRENPFIPMP